MNGSSVQYLISKQQLTGDSQEDVNFFAIKQH